MAHIQITDINPAESGILSDLTEAELLGVRGSGLFRWIRKVIKAIGEFKHYQGLLD